MTELKDYWVDKQSLRDIAYCDMYTYIIKRIIAGYDLREIEYKPSKADSCIYKGPKPLSRSVNFTTFVADYSIAVRQAFLRKRQLNCGISKRIFNKDVTLTETITDRIYKKAA